jgi:16S rRNA (adenine1518-N6/adenine1519-N6)-dimethyltransferase
VSKYSDKVRPKKFLGQHFLNDQSIAQRIVESLVVSLTDPVLEIGPGTGVLTKFFIEKKQNLKVIEIDRDSVAYLRKHYPSLDVIEGDFLKLDLHTIYPGRFSIIGNFAYNISYQILF